jgi:hypothetical protein
MRDVKPSILSSILIEFIKNTTQNIVNMAFQTILDDRGIVISKNTNIIPQIICPVNFNNGFVFLASSMRPMKNPVDTDKNRPKMDLILIISILLKIK